MKPIQRQIQIHCSYLRLFLHNQMKFTVLGFLLAGFVMPAWAGLFSVTPVRIYIAPKERAVAVTITNEGDEPLVMQADLYQWKQKPDGKNDLTLTEDLFLSPPIIKLAPKARQVVRLARMNGVTPTDQLTYRMILREVPEAKPAKEQLEVQIALAFSLPVFITPPTAKRQLGCTVERLTTDSVKAICENTGNAYAYPAGFLLTNPAGEPLARLESGDYILPGIKRSFDLTRKEGKIPAGKAILAVSFDDGTSQNYDVSLAE